MYSDGGRGRGFGSRGRGTRSFGFSRDRDSEDRRQYSRQNFGDRRDTESDESHGGSSSIYVPKSKVGMIIGKGGSKIRELEEDSGCKIQIEDGRNDSEREIILKGRNESQKIARRQIEELTRDDNYRRRDGNRFQQSRHDNWDDDDQMPSSGAPAYGDQWMDASADDEFVMELPSNKIGRVIGRGGSKIRELREQSGCGININDNRAELRGSPNAVSTAKRMIQELIEDDFGRNSRDTGYSQNRARPFGDRRQFEDAIRIEVATNKLGKIIGRGGSKIRELQQDSGARIKILNEEESMFMTPIELKGSESECEEAKQLIEELITEDEIVYGKDAGYSQNRSRQYGDGQQFEGATTRIEVPSNKLGKIIGKGGSKIRELQQDSGARIKILNEEDSMFMTPIELKGSESQCEEAKRLIEELTVEEEVMFKTREEHRRDEEAAPRKLINWAALKEQSDQIRDTKFADLPPIEKNFYIEDPDVANMDLDEVEDLREMNMGIQVVDLHKDGEGTIPNPVQTFEEAFAHHPEILDEIYKNGFQKPTPIQMQAWPIILSGLDLIGIAQTGTGKTLAFLLPAYIHIENQPVPREEREGPTVLVLSPTRELALQIETEVKKYTYRNIKCICVYGGGSMKNQITTVRKGVEIIVATPGRLNDLIAKDIIKLNSITYLVLDEADRMLDMGFEPEIRKVLLDIRPDRQTIMTSATWPEDVRRLAESYMTNPMQVFVGTLDLTAVHSVTQLVEIVDQDYKRARLKDFLTQEMEPEDKVIVFVGRKATADDIASDLALEEINCQCIHGDREQMDREQAIEDLKTGAVRILIATDVASRGLDIKDVTHVFNFDFPRHMEDYVHRCGRTGRAGRTGTSISLLTRGDWRIAKKLIDIMVEAQQEVPDELHEMAERYQRMRERRREEGPRGGFRRGGRGGAGGRFGGRGGRDGSDADFHSFSDGGFGRGFGSRW